MILEDTDVVKALIEYVSHSAIEVLVVGAPAKGGFLRCVCPSVTCICLKMFPNVLSHCISLEIS